MIVADAAHLTSNTPAYLRQHAADQVFTGNGNGPAPLAAPTNRATRSPCHRRPVQPVGSLGSSRSSSAPISRITSSAWSLR